MEYLKVLGKSFLYIILITILATGLITLFSYINFFGTKMVTFFKIIIPILSLFIGGFITGKSSKQKGWLEGLKLGLIIIIVLFIINYFIFKQNWDIRNLVYYLILLSSTIFGSMIGINKGVAKE